MISAMIVLGSLIALSFAILYAVVKLAENSRSPTGWVVAAACFLSCSWVISEMVKHGEKNPCVAYETRTMYNAALKAPMPVRVCVERGEWANEVQP